MDLIFDSSALLSGRFTSLPQGFDSVLITADVREEVRKGRSGRMLDSLLDAGLMVMAPSDVKRAMEAAERTGDLAGLSRTDLSVIALAIERSPVVVATDDFRVQNVLGSLGIQFIPGGELGDRAITEFRKWRPRCRGCGRFFEGPTIEECPICGSEVRPVRSKRGLR